MVKEKGFSLVEILISMAILFLGLGTVVVLMITNIRSTTESRDQVIAMGLAQEATEIMRNFKENNKTFKSSDPAMKANGDYVVDVNTTYAGFADLADKKLYLPADGGYYVHTSAGNNPTKFYRKVNLMSNAPMNQVEVTSYVTWNSIGDFSVCNVANKCVSITSVIPDTQ